MFLVIKGKTKQMHIVSPITYRNLKKELENKGCFFFFNLQLLRNTERLAK